jgi:hypothetical protein
MGRKRSKRSMQTLLSTPENSRFLANYVETSVMSTFFEKHSEGLICVLQFRARLLPPTELELKKEKNYISQDYATQNVDAFKRFVRTWESSVVGRPVAKEEKEDE